MNCLLKSSAVALLATGVASCGILESNVTPSSTATITPLITSGAKVATVSSGSIANSTGSIDARTTSVLGGSGGSIQQIFKTDRCNKLSRGGFIWFTDTVVLDDWLSPLSLELKRDVKSRVDFASQGVLLLDYGVAGKKGAGAIVSSKDIAMKGKEAFITVKRLDPSATSKERVQVVAHPCSLHVMPRTGFETLVIQSEVGDRLTSFANR